MLAYTDITYTLFFEYEPWLRDYLASVSYWMEAGVMAKIVSMIFAGRELIVKTNNQR